MYLDELKTEIGDPLSDEGFQLLCEEAESQIENGYIADQMDLVNYISQLLSDKSSQLVKTNPKRYEELQRYWVLTAFAAFIGYAQDDKNNLLQRRILFAIQKGLDPQSLLDQYYSVFKSEEFIQETFRVFAHDLEENTETFGSTPITVEGKRMLPQLKYWILDYSKFPSKVAKRGAVERLNYVNNSPNAKALTQGQRDVLLSVLKLYDEFMNPTIPKRADADSYEYELADTYQGAPRAVLPVTQPVAQPVTQPIVQNPDQELIVHKLEDLRTRARDESKDESKHS
jgi:hypothetical protein